MEACQNCCSIGDAHRGGVRPPCLKRLFDVCCDWVCRKTRDIAVLLTLGCVACVSAVVRLWHASVFYVQHVAFKQEIWSRGLRSRVSGVNSSPHVNDSNGGGTLCVWGSLSIPGVCPAIVDTITLVDKSILRSHASMVSHSKLMVRGVARNSHGARYI